jgi:transcriptional regulator with XRE-family HTH domain
MKTYDFNKYLQRQLLDPTFKKAYDELADEYDLAAQIIRFRMGQNLTQTQLAKLVGTSQPAIARLESGNHKNVTLAFLFRVARALDLRPELKFRKVGANKLDISNSSGTTRHVRTKAQGKQQKISH